MRNCAHKTIDIASRHSYNSVSNTFQQVDDESFGLAYNRGGSSYGTHAHCGCAREALPVGSRKEKFEKPEESRRSLPQGRLLSVSQKQQKRAKSNQQCNDNTPILIIAPGGSEIENS
ncbi:MAG: hypothetical protein JW846_03385 [Dehalococcoidia bacterium]|nr:hypothetical protein [Dehalococcoidia bacterium]